MVMTAISGIEIAMLGPDRQGHRPAGLPAAGRPLPRPAAGLRQRLVRRRGHARGLRRARARVVASGYRGMKFDPFGTAWKRLSAEEMERAIAIVAAVRRAVGEGSS